MDIRDNYGATALLKATEAPSLVDNKAVVDTKDNNGLTPLMAAA